MSKVHTSYMPTTGAKVTRKPDNTKFVFDAAPQALTIYVRFIELGTFLSGVSSPRIIQIGEGTQWFGVLQDGSSSQYRAQLNNGVGGGLTSALATGPSLWNLVELRATLSSVGVVQLHQSLNGGAETSATASAAAVLPLKWGGAFVYVGISDGASAPSLTGMRNVAIARGSMSLASMRRMAGVAR